MLALSSVSFHLNNGRQCQYGIHLLTTEKLHPSTRLVDSGDIAEEEKRHAGDAAEDENHGQQHEEGRCFEGAGGDGAEVRDTTLTGHLLARGASPNTVMK